MQIDGFFDAIDYKAVIAGGMLIGEGSNMYYQGTTTCFSWELKEGQYVDIMQGSAIFTPFQGNSFSFK